ncbi:cytochrome b [Amphibiibacter pelophylacis]|uniref:Cytochrome bc complex cytochrome b subunit n=1 Tax=Amphibiibacter pelophylacis TaxID=1799477 RepID=A0ACC6P441_9BURK
MDWLESRLPLRAFWAKHISGYRVPATLNVWYVFGLLALAALAILGVSGVFLAMHYVPSGDEAHASVQRMAREVPWGWLLLQAHRVGASAIFVVLALHLWRGLMYGSYRRPRELVWLTGLALMALMAAQAFTGQTLPWGQVSYWAAQVVTGLLGGLPGVGPDLLLWVRGDHTASGVTLTRFYALHVIVLPLLIGGMVVLHIVCLRVAGPSNPDGIDPAQQPLPTVPFHPHHTAHGLRALAIALLLGAALVFFGPDLGGALGALLHDPQNDLPANPMLTPDHIAPAWYFSPLFALLRATTPTLLIVFSVAVALGAVWALWRGGLSDMGRARVLPVTAVSIVLLLVLDARFWGLAVLVGAVALLAALPWLDRSPQRSLRHRPRWHSALYALLVLDVLLLGLCGQWPPSDTTLRLAQAGTLYYYGFFALMPLWSARGRAPGGRP